MTWQAFESGQVNKMNIQFYVDSNKLPTMMPMQFT